MKAYYLLAPLAAAALGGCTYYSRPVAAYYSPPVVYTTPAAVAYASPIYVAPKTIVLGGTPD